MKEKYNVIEANRQEGDGKEEEEIVSGHEATDVKTRNEHNRPCDQRENARRDDALMTLVAHFLLFAEIEEKYSSGTYLLDENPSISRQLTHL